jgi:hypothetical protein
MMNVEVGGQKYEIGRAPRRTLPVWKLIKRDGEPMTGPEFESLPQSDKQALASYVRRHVAEHDAGQ